MSPTTDCNFRFFSELDELKPTKSFCPVASNRSKSPVFLSYNLYGNGKRKVLFVMGVCAVGSYWYEQAKYFCNLSDYQVCLFDNRGIGESSNPPGPYTIEMLTLDTIELLIHLKWTENIHLVGVSMGGMICQRMALKFPSMFSSIILTSTYSSVYTCIPSYEATKLFFKLPLLNSLKSDKAKTELNYPKSFLNELSPFGMNYYQLFQQLSAAQNLDKNGEHAQLSAALSHHLFPCKLKSISKSGIRSLVLHGTKDKVIQSYHGTILASNLKCPLVLFQHSGHMLMIERSKEYNCLLKAHFENLPLSTYLNTITIPKKSYIELKPLKFKFY